MCISAKCHHDTLLPKILQKKNIWISIFIIYVSNTFVITQTNQIYVFPPESGPLRFFKLFRALSRYRRGIDLISRIKSTYNISRLSGASLNKRFLRYPHKKYFRRSESGLLANRTVVSNPTISKHSF